MVRLHYFLEPWLIKKITIQQPLDTNNEKINTFFYNLRLNTYWCAGKKLCSTNFSSSHPSEFLTFCSVA